MRLAGKHGPTDAQFSKQVTVAAVGNAQLRISQLNLLAGSEALRPRCNRGDVHWCESPKSYRPGMSGWLIALIKIWPSRVPLGSEAQHPSRVFQVHPQRQHYSHRAGGGGSVTVAPDRRRNLLEPATSSTRSGGVICVGGNGILLPSCVTFLHWPVISMWDNKGNSIGTRRPDGWAGRWLLADLRLLPSLPGLGL